VSPAHAGSGPGLAERAEFLADEFGRYRRDYEVHTATSTSEAETLAGEITGAGGQVAMFVSESTLPDAPVMEAFGRWRSVVPTARRLVAAHVSRFIDTAPVLRSGLAAGKFDAYLLMPRGVRDDVPADAEAQTRMLGFIGRDPSWVRPAG